ncbi:MAG: hypothetical protein U1E52_06825 [Geminicoccaceae bacterium]
MVRHPFNPNSEVHLQRLAARTGMGRVAVTLARGAAQDGIRVFEDAEATQLSLTDFVAKG